MAKSKTSVRIVMLGSGFVAGFYMQGLANVGGQDVVANYSRKEDRARRFALEWSIPEPTIELSKLIERDDIDLYVIALPNEEHLPVSLALSRAKKNQVCTKPLARTRGEAHAMLRAARRSGALHGYAETEVFAPCVVKARQIVTEGGVGRVLWYVLESRTEGHTAPTFGIRKKLVVAPCMILAVTASLRRVCFSARTMPLSR